MPECNEIEDSETFTYAAEKTKVLSYENAMLEHANIDKTNKIKSWKNKCTIMAIFVWVLLAIAIPVIIVYTKDINQ